MANRTGVYVDDFLADFSTFPLELHRLLSLIRELDTRSQVLQNEIKDEVLQLLRTAQDGNALTPGGASTATSGDGPTTGLKRKLEAGDGEVGDAEGSAESSRVKPRLLQYQDGKGEAEGDEDGAAGRGARLASAGGGAKGEGHAAKGEKAEANGAAGDDGVSEALVVNQAQAAAWATEKVTLSKQACDLLESHVKRLSQELLLFEQDLQQEGKFVAQDDA